jgi:hypothetical protein
MACLPMRNANKPKKTGRFGELIEEHLLDTIKPIYIMQRDSCA